MKQHAIRIGILIVAGLQFGCTSATSESLGSRLRFDKVPPQHEPEISEDADSFDDTSQPEFDDDF